MIYILSAWYATSLWIIWRLTTTRSEVIVYAIAVMLGPMMFPVLAVSRLIYEEKRKWEISNWYRDNALAEKRKISEQFERKGGSK